MRGDVLFIKARQTITRDEARHVALVPILPISRQQLAARIDVWGHGGVTNRACGARRVA
jgi:hypothetical protein